MIVDSFDKLIKVLDPNQAQYVYGSPFIEFEEKFKKEEDLGIMVTRKRWSKDSNEPWVGFQPCGVFTSLDNFAKAIFRDIYSEYKSRSSFDEVNIPKPFIEIYDTDLHINFEEFYQFEINMIPLDRIDLDNSSRNDWKFDI